jgi:rhodanese-related sulfurtransferase
MSARLVAAALALGLGIAAAFTGAPEPAAGSLASRRLLADEIAREADHVTALELAAWIRERRPRLRVIDVRPDSEYAAYHVPTAERMTLAQVAEAPFGAGETIVLYSEGGAHAAQAWVLLRAAGVRDAYFLRGGILEWLDDVMNPVESTELTRYFGGTARQPEAGGAVPMPARAPESVRRLRRRSC